MADKRLRTPLLLQDMCMVHVLLRVEDFPVQCLVLLSHTIRQKIFSGLSCVDILHLDSPGPLLFSDLDHRFSMIEARKDLLEILLVGPSSCTLLFLKIEAALLEHHAYDVLHAHILECYPSLEPISINGFLFPRRYLPFVDLQLPLHTFYPSFYPSLRASMVWPLLYYCNMQRAPTELTIVLHGFKSSVFWMEFDKYMINIKNDSLSRSNPKICLVIPFIQEFFSSVEVLVLEDSCTSLEDMHIISYVLLYNILTSSQPHLKHIKLFGVPDSIERVMSTVVELLNATCTTPSKSTFCLYTGLEPLSLLTTPYLLEGISIINPQRMREGYGTCSVVCFEENLTDCDFKVTCASHLSRDLVNILELHMLNLKNVAVSSLLYLDRMIIMNEQQVMSGKTNVNVPDYKKLLTLLVEFIKQPQFTELTIIKSPLPEGFELILAFLCTPASHEQSLTIEASSQRSVEEAEDDDNEEEEDEEKCIVNVDEMKTNEDQYEDSFETPQKKKFRSDSPMKPPCFPSQPLPLTNAQYKCLDLCQSSDCVYSWLFNQLPELKLKSLKMNTLDMSIVPEDLVIQVEHVVFTLNNFNKPGISSAHLEKFVISNPAIKRLEFIEPADGSFLLTLNLCLCELDQQDRGLEELILTAVLLDRFDDTQLKEFLIQVRDLSHRYGTTLVLSPRYFCNIIADNFFVDLSKKFQEIKIRKIICYVPVHVSTTQLELIADVVDVRHCKIPDDYF